MTVSEFMSQLDGVKVARYDEDREVLFCWWGGHGVHGYIQDYEDCGGGLQEVIYYNTGNFGDRDATEKQIQESITDHMAMDEEEFWSFC